MENFERNITPLILYKRITNQYVYVRKGLAWKVNYERDKNSGAFQWGTTLFFGTQTGIAESIIESLQLLSNEHCQYCDRKQVRRGDVRPTIDHFCPKTTKPIKAFQWQNLFLACDSCQGYKRTKYSKKHLLKFDDIAYNFDRYFYLDFGSGRVLTRLDITPFERCQARFTLMVLGINKHKRTESRLEEHKAFIDTIVANRNKENFSFRFYINRAIV